VAPQSPEGAERDSRRLERASSLTSIQPKLGARARSVALPGVHRLHLARIRYDLYYRVLEPDGPIEILAFWHSSRASGPPI
jgi:plasmid stabilization system protein ParE